MSISEAIARKLISPEHLAYMDALLAYKREKSDYTLFRQRMFSLQDSANPLDRLQWLERKQLHSLRCKQYYAARMAYTDATARAKCVARGIDMSAVDIAKIAAINIPVSMRDMMDEERRQVAIAGMSSEQVEELSNAARAYAAEKQQQSSNGTKALSPEEIFINRELAEHAAACAAAGLAQDQVEAQKAETQNPEGVKVASVDVSISSINTSTNTESTSSIDVDPEFDVID